MSDTNKGESSPKPTPSDFERQLNLRPVGNDALARLDRLERIVGAYVSAVINNEDTILEDITPVPTRLSVDEILAEFRQPVWRLWQPGSDE